MGDRVVVAERSGHDERTSTSAVFKDLGRCTTPAAPCRLIVVIECEMLVGLEGVVASPQMLLVLDVESCKRLAGCPGCGVFARGHDKLWWWRGDRRALGRGSRIRWFKRHMPQAHAILGTLTSGTPGASGCAAIRWAIRQLCFEEYHRGLARQLRNHVEPCGPISSRVCKPHLTPPVSQGFPGAGVDQACVSWDRRRRGARELTGIVD